MKKMMAGVIVTVLIAAIVGCAKEPPKNAEEQPPGYNTQIPESIMTPDKVETRIGTLEFFDGIPTKETAALLYDNLDFMRGVETFLNGMPAASLEAFRLGQAAIGAKNSNQALIFDQLLSGSQEGRADGRCGSSGDRPRDGRRRLLPFRDRYGRSRTRQGQRRQPAM